MVTLWNSWYWHLGLASFIAISGALAGDCTHAQVIPDGTLDAESSIVTPTNSNGIPGEQIDGGAVRGANLFHSFDEFSVPTGGEASFNNAVNIQNIISRVTGGEVSHIDGLLRANGSANLFLVNPNGIIFGPNASLNIGGSFVGSTASAVNFADGTSFSATAHPTTPLLTVSVPIGLQYGGTAGSIRNQSRATDSSGQVVGLQVSAEKTLALLGGDVSLDGGQVQAPGGRVELGGVAGAGTVALNVDNNNLRLSYPEVGQRADVLLTNGAEVSVNAGGGGSISVNARNLNISGAKTKVQAGIGSRLGSAESKAGDIAINATDSTNIDGSIISNVVSEGGVGNAGDINITTGLLSVANGGKIETSTFGQGNAGNLKIDARGQASFINGSFALTTAETGAVGNGGNMVIQAGSVLVANDSQLITSTKGQGNAGNLTIEAGDTVDFMNGAFAFSQVQEGVGDGGEMKITTGSLSVANGSLLSASTLGRGNAGTLKIAARDAVSFQSSSGAFTTVERGAVGNGNDLQIQARSVSVSNGSFLTVATLGQGNAGNVIIDARDSVQFERGNVNSSVGLDQNGVGLGNGGNISITTGSLQLANQSLLSANSYGRQGNAGNVIIEARDTVSLSDQSYVFSQLAGGIVGNAGNIKISTGSLSLASGSILSTDTFGYGNGGNIDIKARDSVSFSTEGGAYSLVNPEGVGNGGNINIITGSLDVADGSFLAASTLGNGNSGNVEITATGSVSLSGVNKKAFSGGIYSEVTTESTGKGGNININARSLAIRDGARVAVDTEGREGDAGSVNIKTTDFISLDNVGSNGNPSGVSSLVLPEGIGKANDINISTRSLFLTNGAVVTADTRGQGDAGKVNIIATDTVSIDGVTSNGLPSRISSTVEEGTIGNGGNINITTRSLRVTNSAELSSSSKGNGAAGNLNLNARSTHLENQGKITADTTVGQGNINLNVRDLLLMRNGSEITTNATGTASGGNINIDSDVIAVLRNSDISANSATSLGGRVRINTFSIFGTQFRSQRTSLSDITATGGTPELSGSVEINRLVVDPTQRLVELPAELVDVYNQIATGCADSKENEFIITGRGGLPPNPRQVLSSNAVQVDWVELDADAPNRANVESRRTRRRGSSPTTSDNPVDVNRSVTEIVEAQGWIVDANGNVTLVATTPTANINISRLPSFDCHAPNHVTVSPSSTPSAR